LQNPFISNSDPIYIPEEIYKLLKRSHIFYEDVLVSIVGTVGMINIVADRFEKLTGSCKIAILHPRKINPWFLNAFLISKYGQDQIQRKVAGAVQTGIILKDLSVVQVPMLLERVCDEIGTIVKKSFKKQSLSEKYYSQAENLLLKELKLEDFQSKDELSYIVNFSEVKSAGRIDAEYFQPKYDQILKKLLQKKTQVLERNFDLIKSKNFQYMEEGKIGVIKTKQLKKRFVNFVAESKALKETITKEKLPILQNKDVLFASMGVGSLGKTNIFYDFEIKDGEFTVDSTLKIFRSKNKSQILPEVLAVFLSSNIGQELIYKHIIGSSGIISIYDSYIRNLPVPILPKSTQQKIASLVKKSHESRNKSKELLKEAKRKVEEMIKKGGG